jgi:hypothetical protein
MSAKHYSLVIAFAVVLMSGCSKNAETTSTEWPSVIEPVSKSDEKKPQAALPHACSLINAEQAQAIIAYPATQMADDPENCMWAGGDNPGRLTMLMVQILRADTPTETIALYDNLTGLSGNLGMMVNEQLDKKTRKSGQDIEGLGDAAWCSSSNADLIGSQQMIVRSGTTIFSFNVTNMSKGERRPSLCPQLETAAKLALDQLGGTP